ncbi:helix-turn-helix transcriptional regulator [Rhodopseudomonas palustris]|uniref:TetR/AcrR family transcriptional regulator n=1 Tax=Rhodopseudomonas palustris TaxID=1076 RepID=UPI00115CBD09|nr:TetR/AcrR family transcriptional regulator [Rhodopseudomonas palustris]QDL98430.1 helix-turn-helix transcriptional regulator [Rhodopseudomonas palustris]
MKRASSNPPVSAPAAAKQAAAARGSTSAAKPASEAEALSTRAAKAAERRAAIIEAALDEFTARGFAATRIDDVAKRAGVAKGTIYLHFTDKEAMFQELVRTALVPTMQRLTAQPASGVSARQLLETFAETFVREVAQTRRGDILRLVMAEGTRFPSLAEFHYRTVVEPGIAGIRRILEIGVARGEIRAAALAQFPQLAVAPVVLSVIWQGLFGRFAPLDVQAMLRAHLDLIFGERTAP